MAAFTGNTPLAEHDPELFALIQAEKKRQFSGIELIASENFTSRAVMECLGSALTNKYAEGLPGARYYGGNQVIDQIENLCRDRALEAYRCNPEEWGVNVQPYSGSPANFAVYTGLLRPHDRIMGLDLPSGGHLTHGFYTYSKKEGTRKAVSATSVYFESLPYRVSPETGLIDYEGLRSLAGLFKPAMIVCGGSAYPRDWDYATLRQIADENGALLMCDMAHVSGLVATQELDNPFEYCDVVTTTTHKSLRGPRAGLIFFKKDDRGFEAKINNAVFPALQGGPHEHQIAGVATQLREVMTPAFRDYARQVKANARAVGAALTERGYTLATGGTDNHLVLWDLRPQGLTGSKMEKICDAVHITLNKNAVPGDRSALSPGGVRVGTPAMTTRGLKEEHFVQVAEFLHRVVQAALRIQQVSGPKLKDFAEALGSDAEVAGIRQEVKSFAMQFEFPGVADAAALRALCDASAAGNATTAPRPPPARADESDSLTLTRMCMTHTRSAGLTLLLEALQSSVKEIARAVRKAGIADLVGLAGANNASGDDVKKLDVLSNEIMIAELTKSHQTAVIISEEEEEPVIVPQRYSGEFIVATDPLDGSSNVDCNVSTGTIFAIWRRTRPRGTPVHEEEYLQAGDAMVCAGYCMYGSATDLVLCYGHGVHRFTLDPSLGEFIHVNGNLSIPANPKAIYSVNEGNFKTWPEATQRAVNSFKFNKPKPYTARYVGSMVSDVHRTLLYGGIYMYPADKKSGKGKLRILYEAMPMALLVEQAGGIASTGTQRILDLRPAAVHDRCPVVIGCTRDVQRFLSFMQ